MSSGPAHRGQCFQPAKKGLGFIGSHRTHDRAARPTREEDAPLERRQDEDAQRYPAHEDPERVIDPDPDAP
jgi:hypothetical protein